MTRPTLHIFTISHYCEKARWALDHHGLDYRLSVLAPGEHAKVARRLGVQGSSLPILETPDGVVHGSSAVLDWADAQGRGETLTPAACAEECRAIESRLDRVAGVHVRRHFYAEALVDYPQSVRPIFERGLSWSRRLMVKLAWSKVRDIMIQRMDLGPDQRLASRQIMDGELAWLDELLADGRPYLVGGQFTRADLAAAALLSPLAGPPEHPVYDPRLYPPLFEADRAEWRERPSLQHVLRMYRDHRGISPA